MDCGTPHLSLLCMGMFKLDQHVVAGASCCDKIDTLFNSPLFLEFAELSNSSNAYVHTPAPTYIWCVKLNEHGHQVSLKESLVAKTEFDALASSNKPFGTLQCVIFPEAQVLLHNKECSPIPPWTCMSFCLHMQTSSSYSKCWDCRSCYNKSNCNVGTVHTIHSLKEKKADLTVSYSHCFALALPLLSTESSSQCPVCRTCQCSVHSPGYSVRITSHSSQLPSTLSSYIMRMASLPADVFVTLCKSKNFSFDMQQSWLENQLHWLSNWLLVCHLYGISDVCTTVCTFILQALMFVVFTDQAICETLDTNGYRWIDLVAESVTLYCS